MSVERNLRLVVESSFLRRIFRAFRHRDFRLMWIGACVSTTGTFVQQFAQSWLVYDMTKNPFYLGLDLFLGQLPIMLFSLFGGVFADRMDRRKMLLYSQYIQMTCRFVRNPRPEGDGFYCGDPLALLHRRLRAVFWRTRLFRAVAGSGKGRGPLQCDRHELHPVQPGAGPRTGAGRS